MAIQKAIDAAEDAETETARNLRTSGAQDARRPASAVIIPSGTFLTGTLWMRSHVELRLEKGAVLKASTRPNDYNANDVFPENFRNDNEEWS